MTNEPQVYAMALYFTVEAGPRTYKLAIMRDYSSQDETYDITIEQDTGVASTVGGNIVKEWKKYGVPEWGDAIANGLATISHLEATIEQENDDDTDEA